MGILALAFTVFAIISLITYSPQDPSSKDQVAMPPPLPTPPCPPWPPVPPRPPGPPVPPQCPASVSTSNVSGKQKSRTSFVHRPHRPLLFLYAQFLQCRRAVPDCPEGRDSPAALEELGIREEEGPKIARKVSVRPAPTSPKTPRISPRWRVRSTRRGTTTPAN